MMLTRKREDAKRVLRAEAQRTQRFRMLREAPSPSLPSGSRTERWRDRPLHRGSASSAPLRANPSSLRVFASSREQTFLIQSNKTDRAFHDGPLDLPAALDVAGATEA